MLVVRHLKEIKLVLPVEVELAMARFFVLADKNPFDLYK